MSQEVRSEMAANVWKLEARNGDALNEGDVIVILESMKMEIPVVSPTSGVISEIHIAEGDSIQEGDLIATLD